MSAFIAVVIAELELRDVQRQVFALTLWNVPTTPRLKIDQKPSIVLRVDRADNVLPCGVVDVPCGKSPVRCRSRVSSVRSKLNFRRNGLANEGFEGGGATASMTRATTLPLRLTAPTTAYLPPVPPCAPRPLVPMPVLGFAADESFVDFHNAHELAEILVRQAGADAVAHVPSGPVGAEAHHALNLERAEIPFLLVSIKWMTRNQSRRGLFVFSKIVPTMMRKAVTAGGRRTRVAEPITGHRAMSMDRLSLPQRGHLTPFGQRLTAQVGAASILGRESLFPLGDRHLVDFLPRGHVGRSRHRRFDGQTIGPSRLVSQVRDNSPTPKELVFSSSDTARPYRTGCKLACTCVRWRRKAVSSGAP